jgi:hypothetical protein
MQWETPVDTALYRGFASRLNKCSIHIPHNAPASLSVFHLRVSLFSTFIETLVEYVEYSTSPSVRVFMNFHLSPHVFP